MTNWSCIPYGMHYGVMRQTLGDISVCVDFDPLDATERKISNKSLVNMSRQLNQ